MAFINGNSSIVTDKLHYYMDPGNKQSYIGSGTSAGSTVGPVPAGTVLGIGAESVFYMNGEISNVMVYNRLLSEGEVTQNYNALKGRFGL